MLVAPVLLSSSFSPVFLRFFSSEVFGRVVPYHACLQVPRGQQGAEDAAASSGRKLFVGGLSSETDEAAFKNYFQTYGAVAEVMIMKDAM